MSQTAEILEPDYKVADISLADWGHKEIAIAETEMAISLRPQSARAGSATL